VRSDFYAIADDLDFPKAQLARLSTRRDMARTAFLSTLATTAVVAAGVEALLR
jgi:hypothetical protein